MASTPKKTAAKRHQYKLAGQAADAAGTGSGKPAGKGGASPARARNAKRERLGKVARYVLVGIGVLEMVLSVSTIACVGILSQ